MAFFVYNYYNWRILRKMFIDKNKSYDENLIGYCNELSQIGVANFIYWDYSFEHDVVIEILEDHKIFKKGKYRPVLDYVNNTMDLKLDEGI